MIGKNAYRCAACGDAFSSPSAFDKHRVGAWNGRHPGYGRRCLTVGERVAKGMFERDGIWRGAAMPEKAIGWRPIKP